MKETIGRVTTAKAQFAFALFCALFVLWTTPAQAIDPMYYAVQASATVQESPAQITLHWKADSNATGYVISRKASNATSWSQIASLPASALSYTDSNISLGTVYEYRVQRPTSSRYSGYGYVTAGIKAPLVDTRGKVLLLVDNTYATDLATELKQMQRNLVGDGWTVIRRDVSRNDSVVNVKNIIKSEYNSDPNNLKAVYIFGHVPVPYSGNFGPDGHDDHQGAWPADTYYADVNGNWTDYSVNRYASRVQTRNVPGDGKFDQSELPSDVELQIGRVDLANMNAFTSKGISEKELLRQYLVKNHTFRHGITRLERRGLICDNFDESGGESFASSGWRNFAAFFGADNVTKVGANQFFSTLGSQGYLWSYGCGGGSYDSCYGVGTTADFANTDIKSAFVMLLGSYFGDFDSDNNFLRGPLGSATYGLASMWSGRPLWFVHPMGLGETIGHTAKLSQNNSNGGLYAQQNWGTRGVHVALMGDPTLRMHPVLPPSNLQLNGSTLSWNGSKDSDIVGYHVYRATSDNGPFTRVTGSPVTTTAYTDNAPSGTYTYMVRAIKLERSGSGTYYNASQGIFADGTSNVGGSEGGEETPTPEPTPVVTVPKAPSNLTAAAGSASEISVNWSDNSQDETGFKIERRTVSSGFAQVGTITANVKTFKDSGLSAGTQYFYRVRAYNSAGGSSFSNEANATTAANATPPPSSDAAAATFVKVDQTTRGTWKGVYGAEGFQVMGDAAKYAGFVQVTPSGKSDWVWRWSDSDPRDLQKVNSGDRIAACWFSGGNYSVDLKVTDGKTHQVAFYLLDWDHNGRVQTVEVRDAKTGALLDQRSVSSFGNGKYLVWNLRGHVQVRFTRVSGPNAVLSGIFFDAVNETPESTPEPAPEPVVIATPTISPNGGTFTNSVSVTLKTATSGATIRYTVDGSTPVATSTLYSGPFTLNASATVKAAAFASGTNSSVASATFTKAVPVVIAAPAISPKGGTFTNSVSVSLASATSGATIRYTTDGSTPNASSALYSAPFTLSNTATVKAIAFASGTSSAVSSATFTKATVAPAPAPSGNHVLFVKSDSSTRGNWKGVYGADGHSVSAFSSALPSYAQVSTSGRTDWIWSWSNWDSRALQKPWASDRVASTWYSASSFTVDLKITDGKSHRVALYFLDWDRNNRNQTVEITDAQTGAVLNMQTVSSFFDGKYLVFDVKGHVKIKLTRNSGYNAVLNGIFFSSSPTM